jgi:hypothetical protein
MNKAVVQICALFLLFLQYIVNSNKKLKILHINLILILIITTIIRDELVLKALFCLV